MEPNVLEYRTPCPAAVKPRTILRWFLLGPLTGACVGLVQQTAAALCWVCYGKPGFYFHGLSGILLMFILKPIGGGLVGIVYGFALLMFEDFSKRRVQLRIAIPSVLLFGFVVSGLFADRDFRRQAVAYVFVPQLLTIGFGLFLSVWTARRAPNTLKN